MSKSAIEILKEQRKMTDIKVKVNKRKMDNAKTDELRKKYRKAYETSLTQSKMLNKQMTAISDGQLKAGKDFVTNSVYTTNVLADRVGVLNLQKYTSLDWSK